MNATSFANVACANLFCLFCCFEYVARLRYLPGWVFTWHRIRTLQIYSWVHADTSLWLVDTLCCVCVRDHSWLLWPAASPPLWGRASFLRLAHVILVRAVSMSMTLRTWQSRTKRKLSANFFLKGVVQTANDVHLRTKIGKRPILPPLQRDRCPLSQSLVVLSRNPAHPVQSRGLESQRLLLS